MNPPSNRDDNPSQSEIPFQYGQEDFCKDLIFLVGFVLPPRGTKQNLPQEELDRIRVEYFEAKYPNPFVRRMCHLRSGWAVNYWLKNQVEYGTQQPGDRIIAKLTAATQLALWEYWANSTTDPETLVPAFEEFLECCGKWQRELDRQEHGGRQ